MDGFDFVVDAGSADWLAAAHPIADGN